MPLTRKQKRGTPSFTLEEYEKYEIAPQWQRDGFASESEYNQEWVRTILAWKKQWEEQSKAIVSQWAEAISYIENTPTQSFDIFVPETQIAQQRMSIALTSLMEQVARLWNNLPQPHYISPDQSQDQYASALNAFTAIELKANMFNSRVLDLGVDVGISSLGVLKPYVDFDQLGPLGNPGKIVIQKIDPRNISLDPTAKSFQWSDMQFIIVEDFVDLGTARKMFKGSEYAVEDLFQTNGEQKNPDGQYGDNLVSPVPNPVQGSSVLRNKIRVLECWFKDDRLRFQADIESVKNTELTDDNQPNPDYDPDKPDIYVRPKVDDEGLVIGRMVPAYPNGRCVVVASDKNVVRDFGNPFWHNRAPFVFYRGHRATKEITTGDLTSICHIDKKLNDIYSRIHTMAQQEIERPMVADRTTFRKPREWMKMSGQATNVIVKNSPQGEFGRLPPTEIPQFVFIYIQKLEQELDKEMSMAGIMRGQLAEGSQLSAEAVSSLQGMATAALKMKAELIAEGMKELGYQLMWLIRQTYPEDINITVTMPDGKQQVVKWNERDAASDYLVDIESGTGLPGQHQASAAQILPMYQAGLIDRIAAHQALRTPGWQSLVQRMEQEADERIKSYALGKAAAIPIKELENPKNSAGGATKI